MKVTPEESRGGKRQRSYTASSEETTSLKTKPTSGTRKARQGRRGISKPSAQGKSPWGTRVGRNRIPIFTRGETQVPGEPYVHVDKTIVAVSSAVLILPNRAGRGETEETEARKELPCRRKPKNDIERRAREREYVMRTASSYCRR